MLAQALDHTAATLQKEVAAELLTGASIQLQIDLAAAPSTQSASEGGSVTAEEEQEFMAVLLLQQMLRGAAQQLQDVPPGQQHEAVDQHTAQETEELLLASAQGSAIAEASFQEDFF
ncbi:hypothetical protein Emag_006362 [Eimeria magna]